MRKLFAAGVAGLFLAAVLAVVPTRAAINGDYVEVRSADVYTGPCFANSEVDLEGKQAILAWKVRNGGWERVGPGRPGVGGVLPGHAALRGPVHPPHSGQGL